MSKSKLTTSVALIGIAMLCSSVAITVHAEQVYDDYDVTATNQSVNRGNISKAEEIKINSPDDFNVAEVLRAKKAVNIRAGTASRNTKHSFSNVDDY